MGRTKSSTPYARLMSLTPTKELHPVSEKYLRRIQTQQETFRQRQNVHALGLGLSVHAGDDDEAKYHARSLTRAVNDEIHSNDRVDICALMLKGETDPRVRTIWFEATKAGCKVTTKAFWSDFVEIVKRLPKAGLNSPKAFKEKKEILSYLTARHVTKAE